jgi:hypothetical protein
MEETSSQLAESARGESSLLAGTHPHMSFRRSFIVIRLLLSVILLFAAGMKAYALWTDRHSVAADVSARRIQLFGVEVESVLAVWLLSGYFPKGAWTTSLLVFTTFSASSLVMALQGRASCGCFGRILVSPWAVFALDLAVLGILVYWRPRPLIGDVVNTLTAAGSVLRATSIRQVLLLGAVIACAGLGAFLGRGARDPGFIDPVVVTVGDVQAGQPLTVEVNLRNAGDHAIQVYGAYADCGCRVEEALPFAVPAGEARSVRLRLLSGPAARGDWKWEYELIYTDDGQRRLALGGACRCNFVSGPEAPGGSQ